MQKVLVTGVTHLVVIKGESIFEGEEYRVVVDKTEIEIDESDKRNSRRGPNQKYNRAEDMKGEKRFEWVRVSKIGSEEILDNVYVRTDTVLLDGELLSIPIRKRSAKIPSQQIEMFGTRHVLNGVDISKGFEFPDNSCLILEYPTPYALGDTIKLKEIADITQNSLWEKAAGRNIHIIGADGRKVVINDKIHEISLRHKLCCYVIKENVEQDEALKMLRLYINTCLEEDVEKVKGFLDYINKVISYKDGTDLNSVLLNSARRVNTIAKYFTSNVKSEIRVTICEKLTKEVEEYSRDLNECLEVANDDAARDSLRKKYSEDVISLVYDSICNLVLFSEVLANNSPVLVIGFGKEHTDLLKELLMKICGVHKSYTIGYHV